MIVFHLFFIKLLIGTVLHLTAPRTLFPEACSTLLYSSDGQLLGARIAPDGQWRFPPADSLPGKFVTCLLTYEDKRFFRHSGVDPVAIVRAMRINLSRGKVVSGGGARSPCNWHGSRGATATVPCMKKWSKPATPFSWKQSAANIRS